MIRGIHAWLCRLAPALLCVPAIFSEPTLSYDKVLNLNSKSAPITLPWVITVKGAAAKDLPPNSEPILMDAPGAAAPASKVVFTFQKNPAPTSNRDEMTLPFAVVVSAFSPSDDGKPREAELILGGTKLKVPYSISIGGQAANSKTIWSALPIADPWVLSSLGTSPQCTSLLVNAGSDPASGVHLGHSTLLEDTSHKPLTRDDLRVCKDRCDTSAPFDLPANTQVSLSVCVLDRTQPGVFKGNIYLAAANRPDYLTIPLDIQSSLFWYKLGGFAFLIMGVLLAIVVIPFTRAAGTRDQQLLLAARRRPAATALLLEVQDLPVPYRGSAPSTRAALNAVLDSLSTTNLDRLNFLPPAQPGPLTSSVDSDGYTKFLSAVDAEMANLSAIVGQGILVAVEQPGPDGPILTAIGAIDALSTTASTAASTAVQAGIAAALQPIGSMGAGKALPAAAAAVQKRARVAKVQRDKSAAQIEKDLARRQRWLNLFVVLFTALTGVLVLIVPKGGFGLTQDYVYCFLWGVGLPAAGQQLTPASVKAAILGS